MATEGGGDEKPLSKGPELSQPMGGIAESEHTDGSQLRLPFITSEPLREDQVESAVKFLSHPKVRGSPVIYRRSFLERKGLTKEEIDEAFRRVPDPPSSATTVETVAISKATQARTSTSFQPQASLQPQAGAVSLALTSQKPRFNWSHALIAIGVLSASGAGSALVFKKAVLPRLKAWIRRVAVEDTGSVMEAMASKSLAAETAEAAKAAKAAASAAAIVATTSQELLNSKNEDRKYFEAFTGMIDVQVKEMKSMSEAIHKLEKAREQQQLLNEYVQYATGNGTSNNSWKNSQQIKVNGVLNTNYGAGQSLTPPSVDPTTGSHRKSPMEIMPMVQRGEINDISPDPNQPPSKPLTAPRTKPWENGQSQEVLSEPWWRKKSAKVTEFENDWPSSQRTWAPPQPPPAALPEFATAVQHPKPLLPLQQQSYGDGKMIKSSIDGNGVATGRLNSGRDSSSVVSQQSEIEEERDDGVEVI